MKKIYCFIFICLASSTVKAQLLAGFSYGTYAVPGMSSGKFRGMAPTLKLVYSGEKSSFFLDASLYNNKNRPAESLYFLDENGMTVTTDASDNYSIKHLQIGFLKLLGDEENKLRFMLGAGLSAGFVKITRKYTLANISSTTTDNAIYGFHFNAGLQWNIEPVILELKGNLDLMLKPVEPDNSDNGSHFINSTRIGILIPITRQKD